MAAIERHAGRPGGLLPLLHDIQDALGYIPQGALEPVAHALHRSVAEVHGVIGFYPHFRRTRPGRHCLRLCLAEACRSMGAADLLARAQQRLGVELHGTAPDGSLTLEPVYCLGNCACAPALLLDDRLIGRVDARRLDEVIEAARQAP